MTKKTFTPPEPEEDEFKGYEVVKNNEVLFTDPTYAICNSFICRNAIQGVRPTLVR